MTTTTTRLEIGSYSHGTLRDVDLLGMFDTIGLIVECGKCRELAAYGNDKLATVEYLETEAYPLNDAQRSNLDSARCELSDTIAESFDHIGDFHTPDGFYFGSHEGDGADFGVWANEDTRWPIEELVADIGWRDKLHETGA